MSFDSFLLAVSLGILAASFVVTFSRTNLHEHIFRLLSHIPGLRLLLRILLRKDTAHYSMPVYASTIEPGAFDIFSQAAYKPLFAELFSCMYCLSWHAGFWCGLFGALVSWDWLVLPSTIGIAVAARHQMQND